MRPIICGDRFCASENERQPDRIVRAGHAVLPPQTVLRCPQSPGRSSPRPGGIYLQWATRLDVAAGVPPAVEGGILPPGKTHGIEAA
jgi:hypothetical protein